MAFNILIAPKEFVDEVNNDTGDPGPDGRDDDPDDTRRGADFFFNFDHRINLWSVGILDSDGNEPFSNALFCSSATGGTVYNAREGARQLRSQGLDARAVNVHTIKPIDRELILDSIQRSGRILTVEDHGLSGGLGSAVSEVVAERGEGLVRRIAVRDFGESGDPVELYKKFGLSKENIVAEARKLVKKD